MKKYILSFLFFIFISNLSIGELTVNAGVKYQRSDESFSSYYYREISIFTGVELNISTKTKNYDNYSDYVLIWFNQGQVSIIKLNKKIQPDANRFVSKSISKELLDLHCQIYGYTKDGVDQDGTYWKICFYPESYNYQCN